MLENIALAFQGIWNHKLRSLLTMLGIIIGIAAIITIVSTIKGTNDQIKQNLIGAGNNTLVVSLHQGEYAYDFQYGSLPDGVNRITEDTRKELAQLSNVEDVSLFHSRSNVYEQVYYRNTSFAGDIYGVDSRYLSLYGYTLCYGRGFTEADFSQARKVTILQDRVASTLFGGANPVGKVIEIQGEPFVVVGVVAQSERFKPVIETLEDYNTYADTSAGRIFLPDDVWPILYGYDEPQSAAIRAASTDDMTEVGKQASKLLTDRQIVKTKTDFSYRSTDILEQAKKLQSMSNSTSKQLLWIAGISLVVGGIGVMNIMLVSVTERTNEIGLKKAIGAKRRKIRRQFLTEAAALTSLGGILGVIAGIAMSKLWTSITETPTSISIPAIAVSVLFSMLIGIVFGLLPSNKAASLNPIDALRRD